MKNIIIGFGIIMMLLFTFGSIAIIEVDSGKEETLVESVRTAVYQTMKEVKNEESWRMIQNQYESQELEIKEGYTKEDAILACRFKENVGKLLDGTGDVYVSILEANFEKGVLSVEVKLQYKNFGIMKQKKTMETVIYNVTK